MPDQRINMVITAQDLASRNISTVRKNLMALGTSTGGALGGVLGGLGVMGSAGGPAFLAGTMISTLGRTLVDAAQAAIEDEKSVARLTTALEDNIEGFTGNTAAIDEYIEAGQKRAFTDDAQREAIGKLVVRTHDEAEALNLTTLAMDLARGKGIDLASAAELVGKAYSGQVGALRRAGLAIDANASSTEALAAIQEAFGGQAETFAETTEGSMQAMQIAVDEAWESIGARLLPALKEFADFVQDDVIPVVEHLGNALGLVFDEMGRSREAGAELWKPMEPPPGVELNVKRFFRTLGDYGPAFAADMRNLAPEVRDAWQTGFLDPAMQIVKRAKHAIPAETTSMMDRVEDALSTGTPDLRDRWREIKKLWDPDWIEKQSRDAERLLRQANRARERLLETGHKDAIPIVDSFIADMADRAALFDALDSTMTLNVNTKFGGNRPSRNQRLTQHRAGGGPTMPYNTYLVGEEGPELLHMGSQSGYVQPNGQWSGARGVAPHSHPIAVDGRVLGRALWPAIDEESGRRMALSSSAAVSYRG